MVTRREILKQALTAAAVAPIAACAGKEQEDQVEDARTDEQQSAAGPIGLAGVQLYTVRSLMSENVGSTLAAVSQIGYKEVEFAGYFDHPASEIAAMLSDNGLTAPAAHFPGARFHSEMQALVEIATTIGHEYLVCPFIPEEERQTLDDYRRFADMMNVWGAACQTAGIQFAYHNHAFEFEPMAGEIPYDILLDRTDPSTVAMEIDLFWVRDGGHDPLTYFERYPGRFKLCHVKDMTAGGEMTEVGSGIIDFASDFAHAEQAGLEHFFVEHDQPDDPQESIRTSYEALSKLL